MSEQYLTESGVMSTRVFPNMRRLYLLGKLELRSGTELGAVRDPIGGLWGPYRGGV